MSEKKLTPIQEAIFYIKETYSVTITEDSALQDTLAHLQSLLPKEKEFAKEMWDHSLNYYASEYKLEKDYGKNQMKPQPNFDEYYKQYEP